MTFATCWGSLESGKLDVTNLRVKTRTNSRFSADLAFERLGIDLGSTTTDLLRRDLSFLRASLESLDDQRVVIVSKLAARGVVGDFALLVRHPETPLPNVLIREVTLQDVDVTLADGHQRSIPLQFPPIKIDAMQMSMYRLRKPLNALLFGSTGQGTVGGAPFFVEKSKLLTASVPVEFLSSFLRPPLSWIKMGNARVRVAMEPVPGSGGTWAVETTLSLHGSAESGDASVYGAATSQVTAYLNDREVAVSAKEEITEDPANEDAFLQKINQKFATLVLAKVGGAVVAGAAAGAVNAAKSVKSWWG